MKHKIFEKIAARVGILLLTAILLALPFTLSVAAAEEASLPTVTTDIAAPGDRDSATGDHSTAAQDSSAAEVTVAGAIAAFLRAESAGLLSGATLLLTLIISLSFRKRIIPSLLDALSTLIGKSREAVGAITEGHEAEHAELLSLLERVEEMLSEARAATAAAESAAAILAVDSKAKTLLEQTLSEQSDLLYELLMSANLPQYQKDRIGAQHARVRAALSGDSHD